MADFAIPPFPPSLYAKLQQVAEPLVDTPLTAIEKALDFYLLHKTSPGAAPGGGTHVGNPGIMMFAAEAPPDLSFTRPLSIEIEGRKLDRADCYWNPLLYETVRLAGRKLNDADRLKQILLCNHVDGARSGEGYHPIPGAGVSVQGQATNPAWKSIMHVAKALRFKIDVTFIWEDKPKAQYPGKTGRMVYMGK
ncbi:MAG TPA: hypothetical protein VMH86_10790 [Rhizomicrobium sp.]|nr:hypothetical protein [Rhizomicrobium sp.]